VRHWLRRSRQLEPESHCDQRHAYHTAEGWQTHILEELKEIEVQDQNGGVIAEHNRLRFWTAF
jgi:hypothetical protein